MHCYCSYNRPFSTLLYVIVIYLNFFIKKLMVVWTSQKYSIWLYQLDNRLPQIHYYSVVLTVSITAIKNVYRVACGDYWLSLQSPYKNKDAHVSIWLEILNLSTIMKAGHLFIIHQFFYLLANNYLAVIFYDLKAIH